MTIFLAKFACSTRSTCVKGIGTESTCIKGSYTKKVYIRGIYSNDAYIRNISTCTNNTYIRYIYSKSISIWSTCIKPSYIGSTFIWDIGSKSIGDGGILLKCTYTRNVYAIKSIYICTRDAYIISFYIRNTWIRGIYTSGNYN